MDENFNSKLESLRNKRSMVGARAVGLIGGWAKSGLLPKILTEDALKLDQDWEEITDELNRLTNEA